MWGHTYGRTSQVFRNTENRETKKESKGGGDGKTLYFFILSCELNVASRWRIIEG